MKNYVIYMQRGDVYHDIRRSFNGKHQCCINMDKATVTDFEGIPEGKRPCLMCFPMFKPRYNAPDTPYQEAMT